MDSATSLSIKTILKTTDQSALAEIAMSEVSICKRRAAICNLVDVALLKQVEEETSARDNNDDGDIRSLAYSKLYEIEKEEKFGKVCCGTHKFVTGQLERTGGCRFVGKEQHAQYRFVANSGGGEEADKLHSKERFNGTSRCVLCGSRLFRKASDFVIENPDGTKEYFFTS